MRFKIYEDSLGKNLVIDTHKDRIVSKQRNAKTATRICQKLNQRLIAKTS